MPSMRVGANRLARIGRTEAEGVVALTSFSVIDGIWRVGKRVLSFSNKAQADAFARELLRGSSMAYDSDLYDGMRVGLEERPN